MGHPQRPFAVVFELSLWGGCHCWDCRGNDLADLCGLLLRHSVGLDGKHLCNDFSHSFRRERLRRGCGFCLPMRGRARGFGLVSPTLAAGLGCGLAAGGSPTSASRRRGAALLASRGIPARTIAPVLACPVDGWRKPSSASLVCLPLARRDISLPLPLCHPCSDR